MEHVYFVIKILENILYIALPSFILSTYYLIIFVKKRNIKLIKNSIKNPLWPNLDLNFFKKLQEEYKLEKSCYLPVIINRVSFYTVIIGFIFLLLMVVAQEFLRYE